MHHTGHRKSSLARLAGDTRAAVAVEYLVVMGVVALAVLGGFRYLGGELADKVFCQAQSVLTLSATDCAAAGTGQALASVDIPAASGQGARQHDTGAEPERSGGEDACKPGWRGGLCRLAHRGGELVRDVVGDWPGGDFIADYATAAWSLPDAILQSTLPLLGLGGAGAPGVGESWIATGKQTLALGCAALPGSCGALNSGSVPGFSRGEVLQIQRETGKAFVGWDHWADGEYGTAAGTLFPNLALTLIPGPKVASLGRTARVAARDGADADVPCTGGNCPAGSGVCFTAGTLVHAAKGLVPIERIARGDFVWSRDERTNALGLRRVARTFVHQDKAILEVAFADAGGEHEVLHATPEHPFWTRERGWVAAVSLRAGEAVLQRAGVWSKVIGTRALAQRAEVFNFEVEQFHTYFVGQSGVWVHNECQEPLSPEHRRKLERRLQQTEYAAGRADSDEAERSANARFAARLRARLAADDALRGGSAYTPPRTDQPWNTTAGPRPSPGASARTPPRAGQHASTVAPGDPVPWPHTSEYDVSKPANRHHWGGVLDRRITRWRSSEGKAIPPEGASRLRDVLLDEGFTWYLISRGVEVHLHPGLPGFPDTRYELPGWDEHGNHQPAKLTIDGSKYGLDDPSRMTPQQRAQLVEDMKSALANPPRRSEPR